MADSEKRVHPRSQFFLVRADGQSLPVYAFRPEQDDDATPALIVDLSSGGLQTLTDRNSPLGGENFVLEVSPLEDGNADKLRMPIELVWQKRDGLYTRTGFACKEGQAVNQALSNLLLHTPHKMLRCVLHPSSGC